MKKINVQKYKLKIIFQIINKFNFTVIIPCLMQDQIIYNLKNNL